MSDATPHPWITTVELAAEFERVAPTRIEQVVRLLGLHATSHVRVSVSPEAASLVRRELRSRGIALADISEAQP